MQSSIVLTGSSGFLGKTIIDKLSLQRVKVVSIGRHLNDDIFCDLSLTPPLMPSHNIDVVIHLAGKAHVVPKNDTEIQAIFDVNVKGTQNLLLGIELNGMLPKSFIFISSIAVYGLDQGNNIDETTPLLAKDPYGLSKIQAEQIVLDWCKNNNVICTILRLPLLVGDNPPGNLGAMINSIKKGYYFNIGGGLVRKSMVLTEDVANILLKISEIGGVYNLTDGYHPSFYELSNVLANRYSKSRIFNISFPIAKCIALIGDVFGRKFPINSKKLKKLTTELTFDDTKVKQVIIWNPKKVLNFFCE